MSEKLSANSWRSEWACKCGCGLDNIDLRLMVIFELIRHFEGDKPMSPSSACRCISHNERVQMDDNEHYVPFSSRSRHLPFTNEGTINDKTGLCTAGDFKSRAPKKLFDFLDKLFPNMYGIGVYSWGIHIDTDMNKRRWNRL